MQDGKGERGMTVDAGVLVGENGRVRGIRASSWTPERQRRVERLLRVVEAAALLLFGVCAAVLLLTEPRLSGTIRSVSVEGVGARLSRYGLLFAAAVITYVPRRWKWALPGYAVSALFVVGMVKMLEGAPSEGFPGLQVFRTDLPWLIGLLLVPQVAGVARRAGLSVRRRYASALAWTAFVEGAGAGRNDCGCVKNRVVQNGAQETRVLLQRFDGTRRSGQVWGVVEPSECIEVDAARAVVARTDWRNALSWAALDRWGRRLPGREEAQRS